MNTKIRRIIIVPDQKTIGVLFEASDGTTSSKAQAQLEIDESVKADLIATVIAGLGNAVAELVDAKPAALTTAMHQLKVARDGAQRAAELRAEAEQEAQKAEAAKTEAEGKKARLEADIEAAVSELAAKKSELAALKFLGGGKP